MSTRSTISVQLDTGRIRQSYCHYDGYLNHVGRILIEHFNTQELAEYITSLGEIRSLETDGGIETFTNIEVPSRLFNDEEHYQEKCYFQSYNYLFKNGKWWVDLHSQDSKLVPVEYALT